MTQTFNCPSCGAPIEPSGSKTTIRCKYCNASVIVPPGLRKKPKPVKKIETSLPVFKTADVFIDLPVVKTNNRRNYLIIGGVSLVVIVAIFISIIPFSSITGNTKNIEKQTNAVAHPTAAHTIAPPTAAPAINTSILNPIILAPLAGVQSPDFLAVFRNQDAWDITRYALVDGKKHTMIWQSDDFGKDHWTEVKALPTEKQVFIFNQGTLTALDRQTGKKNWESHLDYGPNYYCEPCMGQYQNALVVIEKDGTVQALDASNGKMTWRRTINNSDANLLTVDGKPAIEDKDAENKPVFNIFDPSSGEIVHKIALGCTANDTQDALHGTYLSDDGKSLYLFFKDCLQHVSLPEGTVLSQALEPTPEGVWTTTWFAASKIIANGMLYYSEDMGGSERPIIQMDIAKGNPSILISVDNYAITPVYVTNNILIVEARPDFDFEQVEFWGVDTRNGQCLWKYSIKGKGRLENYGFHPTSKAAFMFQCREDPGGCAWSVVDPQTGVGSNSVSIPHGSPSYITWGKDDTLYLVSNFTLKVINTLNSQQIYTWP
jgi:outer membrane protein assembly factor BamB